MFGEQRKAGDALGELGDAACVGFRNCMQAQRPTIEAACVHVAGSTVNF